MSTDSGPDIPRKAKDRLLFLMQLVAGEVPDTTLVALPVVFQGEDRVCVSALRRIGSENAVVPLAIIVTDDLAAQLVPPGNPEFRRGSFSPSTGPTLDVDPSLN